MALFTPMSRAIVKCDCCDKIIVYPTEKGPPDMCPHCGCGKDEHLSPAELNRRLEEMQRRQAQQMNMNGMNRMNVRWM